MPFRPSSLVVAAGLVAGAFVGLPAAPAAAEEAYAVPSGGVFSMEGHGWGHGHGMSQWGAQGAASLGKTADQITGFYYPGTTRTTLSNSSIRVLVSADTGGDTQVYAATGLTVRDLQSGAAATLPAGPTRWRTTTDSSGLHLQSYDGAWKAYALAGKTTFAGPIEFAGPAAIRLALPDGTSRDYRGVLRSNRTSATAVQTVNVLPMESYLRGVVPRESSASWKPAALQAQSIAARTYAAENRARYASTRSYDICDTTMCQVYGGAASYTSGGTRTSVEAASTNDAIAATNGVIRTYGGKPIFAQFSSSNGGWTTDGGLPYLPAQRDDWDGAIANSVHSWTATVTAAQIQARYPAVGTLKRLRVTQRDGNGEWGGRVKAVVLEGVSASGQPTSVSTTGAGIYNAHSWPAYSDGMRSSWWHVRDALAGALVSKSGAPTLVRTPGTSTGTLSVVLKNTGAQTWPASGLHLATASPVGAADPLVGGSTTPGRYTGTADVAPGSTASFSFSLTGDGVSPGTYVRSYRLRIGTGPVFGPVVSWTVTVKAASYTAAVAGPAVGTAPRPTTEPADAPDPVSSDGRWVTLPINGTVPMRLSIKNTSNFAWPADPTIRLASTSPRAHTKTPYPSSGSDWVNAWRPSSLAAATPIGGTGTFDLVLHGNELAVGVTQEAYEPIWDARSWFEGALTTLNVVRVDPRVSRLAALESAPTTLALDNGPSGTATLSLRLRNLGGDPWTVGTEQLSASATPLTTSAWSSSTSPPPLTGNLSRPGQAKVYPGEVGEWRVPVSAFKDAAGTYSLSFQARGPSGAYGPSMPVTVSVKQAVLAGKLGRVHPSVDVPRSGTATTWFEVQNTGNIDWPVKGMVRSWTLAGAPSPSYHSTWIGPRRPGPVSLNVTRPGATTVRPGETARFLVVLAGNGRTPRTTSEAVGALWEGWLYVPDLRATLLYRVV